jgi:hypothetical protein
MVEGLNSPEIAERLVVQAHRAVALAVQQNLVGSSASDLRSISGSVGPGPGLVT